MPFFGRWLRYHFYKGTFGSLVSFLDLSLWDLLVLGSFFGINLDATLDPLGMKMSLLIGKVNQEL